METVLSKAGLKVLDIVEIVRQPKGFPDLLGKTGRITEYEGEDRCVVDIGGSHPLYVIEISTLRRIDPTDPQPEDEVSEYSDVLSVIKSSMSGEEFRGYCKAQAVDLILNGGGIASVSKAVSLLNCMLEQANENAQD